MPAALVQQQHGGGVGAVASITLTLPGNIASGNILYCLTVTQNSLDVGATPSGLTGGTWTLVRDQHVGTVGHSRLYKYVGGTTGTIITVSVDSGTARVAAVAGEFSGVADTPDGDNGSGLNNNAPTTGTITTTHNNDLVLIMLGERPTADTITGIPNTGYTGLTDGVDDGLVTAHMEYQVSAATGTYSGTWATTSAHTWEALVFATQESAGGAALTGSDDYFRSPQRTVFAIPNPLFKADVMVPTVTFGKNDDRSISPTRPVFRIPAIVMGAEARPAVSLGKSDDQNIVPTRPFFRTPLIPSWSDTVVPTVTLGKFDDRMIGIPKPIFSPVRTFINADILAAVQAAAPLNIAQWQWQLSITSPGD